jgi:hypothetical protein
VEEGAREVRKNRNRDVKKHQENDIMLPTPLDKCGLLSGIIYNKYVH